MLLLRLLPVLASFFRPDAVSCFIISPSLESQYQRRRIESGQALASKFLRGENPPKGTVVLNEGERDAPKSNFPVSSISQLGYRIPANTTLSASVEEGKAIHPD